MEPNLMPDLSDEALFCDLPNIDEAQRGHGGDRSLREILGLPEEPDDSFAYAYNKEFRARQVDTVEFSFEVWEGETKKDRLYQRSRHSAGLAAVQKHCRDAFHMLGYMVSAYLDNRRPIRRFPASIQQYFYGEGMNCPINLDFIAEVQTDDDAAWSATWTASLESSYKEIKEFAESKSAFSYCLGYVFVFLICLALLWWSLGEVITLIKLVGHLDLWAQFPVLEKLPLFAPASNWLCGSSSSLELQDLLLCVVFGALLVWSAPKTLLSLIFIVSGFDVDHQREQTRAYCRLVEEHAVKDYRFARFCQLWCQAEGREVPQLFLSWMDEAKRALGRRQAILRRWPNLAQPAGSRP